MDTRDHPVPIDEEVDLVEDTEEVGPGEDMKEVGQEEDMEVEEVVPDLEEEDTNSICTATTVKTQPKMAICIQ